MDKKQHAHECEGSNTHDLDGGISEGAARSQSVYNERPGGSENSEVRQHTTKDKKRCIVCSS